MQDRKRAESRAYLAPLVLAGVAVLVGVPAEAGDIWLGLGAGQVKPEAINSTVALSGELRLELGPHFALQPDLGYWKRSETASGVSVSASDFSFGVTVAFFVAARYDWVSLETSNPDSINPRRFYGAFRLRL